ncbi:hypothetical protein OE88DRAFT_1641110 [Heliocybe sulcata]|uniref:Uncharacterized protein n=1 Tax=Heliocybe sulcata TaxID=5364 RepID=A0A5C3NHR4_9AGAM|nr:hypothetical protein OE88DRAFT_1641110 [Heliocybe sulcata]
MKRTKWTKTSPPFQTNALHAERDNAFLETKAGWDDLEGTIENPGTGLRQQEQNVAGHAYSFQPNSSTEKYKHEKWDLEGLEGEHKHLAKQLNTSRDTAEQHKSETERQRIAYDELKAKHEMDTAHVRRSTAGLQREDADLRQTIETMKAEVARAAKKLPRFGSATPNGVGESQLSTPGPKEEGHVCGTKGGPSARNKKYDASGFFGDSLVGELDDSPDPSPRRPFKAGSHPASETEVLQQRLAHAQRQINTPKATVQREKEMCIDYKRRLEACGQKMGTRSRKKGRRRKSLSVWLAEGAEEVGVMDGLPLPSSSVWEAKDLSDVEDEDDFMNEIPATAAPAPHLPTKFRPETEDSDEEVTSPVQGTPSPTPSNHASIDGMDSAFANILHRSLSAGSLPNQSSPLRQSVAASRGCGAGVREEVMHSRRTEPERVPEPPAPAPVVKPKVAEIAIQAEPTHTDADMVAEREEMAIQRDTAPVILPTRALAVEAVEFPPSLVQAEVQASTETADAVTQTLSPRTSVNHCEFIGIADRSRILTWDGCPPLTLAFSSNPFNSARLRAQSAASHVRLCDSAIVRREEFASQARAWRVGEGKGKRQLPGNAKAESYRREKERTRDQRSVTTCLVQPGISALADSGFTRHAQSPTAACDWLPPDCGVATSASRHPLLKPLVPRVELICIRVRSIELNMIIVYILRYKTPGKRTKSSARGSRTSETRDGHRACAGEHSTATDLQQAFETMKWKTARTARKLPITHGMFTSAATRRYVENVAALPRASGLVLWYVRRHQMKGHPLSSCSGKPSASGRDCGVACMFLFADHHALIPPLLSGLPDRFPVLSIYARKHARSGAERTTGPAAGVQTGRARQAVSAQAPIDVNKLYEVILEGPRAATAMPEKARLDARGAINEGLKVLAVIVAATTIQCSFQDIANAILQKAQSLTESWLFRVRLLLLVQTHLSTSAVLIMPNSAGIAADFLRFARRRARYWRLYRTNLTLAVSLIVSSRHLTQSKSMTGVYNKLTSTVRVHGDGMNLNWFDLARKYVVARWVHWHCQ